MSRNAEEGFELYKELYDKGVELVFLKEPHINTETYRKTLSSQIAMTGERVDYILEGVNKYLMSLAKEQIRLAFVQSQKEVEYLQQRTREGIETARANGKQIGRPVGSTSETKKSKEAKKAILKYSKNFNGHDERCGDYADARLCQKVVLQMEKGITVRNDSLMGPSE